jgi:hypothetical protein
MQFINTVHHRSSWHIISWHKHTGSEAARGYQLFNLQQNRQDGQERELVCNLTALTQIAECDLWSNVLQLVLVMHRQFGPGKYYLGISDHKNQHKRGLMMTRLVWITVETENGECTPDWNHFLLKNPLSVDVTPRITGNLLLNAALYIRDPPYIISMQTRHMVTNSTWQLSHLKMTII